ncbi:hypothetical protein FALBO_9768 [Fusarium albosuccineum]|uniref:Uncharacterized protein n=1 Tax=Fusarium albosuccineum TaxID=1237068 RepID=A0A8H4P8P5_9HYPO|nr:hypothetical protein FALBO_9768 [Fusarium albosuccineum]
MALAWFGWLISYCCPLWSSNFNPGEYDLEAQTRYAMERRAGQCPQPRGCSETRSWLNGGGESRVVEARDEAEREIRASGSTSSQLRTIIRERQPGGAHSELEMSEMRRAFDVDSHGLPIFGVDSPSLEGAFTPEASPPTTAWETRRWHQDPFTFPDPESSSQTQSSPRSVPLPDSPVSHRSSPSQSSRDFPPSLSQAFSLRFPELRLQTVPSRRPQLVIDPRPEAHVRSRQALIASSFSEEDEEFVVLPETSAPVVLTSSLYNSQASHSNEDDDFEMVPTDGESESDYFE